MKKIFWLVLVIFLIVAVLYVVVQSLGPSPGTIPSQLNENGLLELNLGETGRALGVKITPKEVIEDSRCPLDVFCIQAGTVRVRAMLESGLGSGPVEQIFQLGMPITTEVEQITLVATEPTTRAGVKIEPAEYLFFFEVKGR